MDVGAVRVQNGLGLGGQENELLVSPHPHPHPQAPSAPNNQASLGFILI